MVARLVLDAIWRNRWAYVVMALFLLFCWLIYVIGGSDAFEISMPALSLIFAAAMGPMVAITTMGLRELRHLPVTNRDLWRATWILATVVASGGLLGTKMLSTLLVAAFGGTPQLSVATMLLSAVYDFSWAGAVLLVLPLLGYAGNIGTRRGTLPGLLTVGAMMLALLACFVLPMLAGGALPTDIGDLTPATSGVLIAGLAIALGGLAWTPRRSTMSGLRPGSRPASAMPAIATRPRLSDRLTGISRVLIPHVLVTLILPIAVCLSLAAYGVVSGPGPWWFVPPTPEVFDPADTGYRGLTYFVLLPSFAAMAMQGLWTPWVRVLKTLPLSVRQINALQLFTPFATWTILWLLGWFGYALAYGVPQTLRLEFVFGMAGLTAAVHAVLLRFQGSAGLGWIFGAMGGLMPPVANLGLSNSTVARILFSCMGVAALCYAAFLNHRTLTRSTSTSRTYRQPQPPFGMAAKPGLR